MSILCHCHFHQYWVKIEDYCPCLPAQTRTDKDGNIEWSKKSYSPLFSPKDNEEKKRRSKKVREDTFNIHEHHSQLQEKENLTNEAWSCSNKDIWGRAEMKRLRLKRRLRTDTFIFHILYSTTQRCAACSRQQETLSAGRHRNDTAATKYILYFGAYWKHKCQRSSVYQSLFKVRTSFRAFSYNADQRFSTFRGLRSNSDCQQIWGPPSW